MLTARVMASLPARLPAASEGLALVRQRSGAFYEPETQKSARANEKGTQIKSNHREENNERGEDEGRVKECGKAGTRGMGVNGTEYTFVRDVPDDCFCSFCKQVREHTES